MKEKGDSLIFKWTPCTTPRLSEIDRVILVTSRNNDHDCWHLTLFLLLCLILSSFQLSVSASTVCEFVASVSGVERCIFEELESPPRSCMSLKLRFTSVRVRPDSGQKAFSVMWWNNNRRKLNINNKEESVVDSKAWIFLGLKVSVIGHRAFDL